jgi:enoyl-CoA hydratase
MNEIEFAVEDNVATLTLNAPDRRNALTPEMARELVVACDEADADSDVGAVVIQAQGKSFCAGGDRETLVRAGEDPADDERLEALTSIYRAFVRVGGLRAPTIAAIRGAAVGAGVNLALATDLRIVGTEARFIAGFLRIGVHPGGGHFTLMGRLAGREATAAAAIFGEEIDGARAVELGLAWQLCSDDKVEGRARELALRAARDPELARRAVRSMRNELGPPSVSWPLGLESETATQLWSLRRALLSGRLQNPNQAAQQDPGHSQAPRGPSTS